MNLKKVVNGNKKKLKKCKHIGNSQYAYI